ncbi:hypothetical protein IGI04_003455 [Brassica rapa subsp. trilocularis]|uniref:Uncharacterized protein n=1 Tax=Brassica rapa subsp. trilocularis TaxID=1813537 RepID=A0ABQ7NYF5_BRACM|nr:hypothetical protein IGI04_003455 [Brassica rapa subsp. trilocularis]
MFKMIHHVPVGSKLLLTKENLRTVTNQSLNCIRSDAAVMLRNTFALCLVVSVNPHLYVIIGGRHWPTECFISKTCIG